MERGRLVGAVFRLQLQHIRILVDDNLNIIYCQNGKSRHFLTWSVWQKGVAKI